jgi:hypothetical protein
VGGLCYWDIKQKALNGGRSKLSAEQLGFVGVVSTTVDRATSGVEGSDTERWLQPNPSNIDRQLDELERLLDIAPGWYALARKIVEEES